MNENIHHCILGNFSLKDAFDLMDIFFEAEYLSVSTVEEHDHWLIEILDNKSIENERISVLLKNYRYSILKCEKIPSVDWLKKCFENFKPIIVGDFYIFGNHLRNTPIPVDKIGIEITAATAFGTGEHPTTNRCLMACQTFFDARRHKASLDLGSGSGILSIALAKLGCRHVTACDNDPEAVRVTRNNVITNKVSHRVEVFRNELHEFSRKNYDFVIANILSEPLVTMAQHVLNCLAPNGLLVLSGFTSHDKSVINKYLSLGLRLKYIYNYHEWTTAVFESQF
ncbi:MAG: 50S ribosomal protein L11 methyltransferase [Holosporaceae bacterium]|jgi:ribosomal protein L11 methyltransferase|nr:50S ribosomal protein L11 methyltransferase [Holosporaceae bacterium]